MHGQQYIKKIICYVIYLFTAIVLTPGGSSTVHIYTNNTQNNTMKQNVQNGTYITIRIHNLQNKTEAYKRIIIMPCMQTPNYVTLPWVTKIVQNQSVACA